MKKSFVVLIFLVLLCSITQAQETQQFFGMGRSIKNIFANGFLMESSLIDQKGEKYIRFKREQGNIEFNYITDKEIVIAVVAMTNQKTATNLLMQLANDKNRYDTYNNIEKRSMTNMYRYDSTRDMKVEFVFITDNLTAIEVNFAPRRRY